MNVDFERDYELGKVDEREAARLVCARDGVTVIHVQDKYNYRWTHYDFKMSDLTTYEAKSDKKSLETGNIFVEFLDRGKPSGIAITTADYHIFKSEAFYQIPTAVLKELVKGRRTASAKNKKTKALTWGYLVPRQVFINASVLLPPVPAV